VRSVQDTPYFSRRIGPLPKGCRACVKGAKLVLLATGVCGERCWYCPLSERKKNKDVVVANEWWVKSDGDILEEARLCGATGAGITGGDPLCRLDRTIRYIRLLKRSFGKGFHIHLYSPTAKASPKALDRLRHAGLDEIRFHPDFLNGEFGLEAMREALKHRWDVGCEIPVVPKRMAQTKAFIRAIDALGVKFLNLNQLEVSETNAAALERRGYTAESDVSFSVKGSARMADRLLRWCAKYARLRVHYCTVKLKDGVQLRNRLRRRARNVAKAYDIVTSEGLLIRGAAYAPETMPSFGYGGAPANIKPARRAAILKMLAASKAELGKRAGKGLVEVDARRLRLLTGAWVAEELAGEIKSLGLRPAVVEEYPTWDALITDLKAL
jgi:uncharacterized protein